jgi:23S rRNA (adenine2030-N6)-methyltransferase
VKYRHRFHAGNFADVHKHVVLIALIEALQRKEKGFLYVDTHAGEGLYDLRSDPDTPGGHESVQGIGRLLRAPPPGSGAVPTPIARYLDLVTDARHCSGLRRACPGSPWIATRLLRPQDRAVFCEWRTEAFVALRRLLHDAAHVRCEHADGYARLPALLPPPERRGLVLIDPPYEDGREDRSRIAATLERALRRFATGVYALWYPIKREADSSRWLETLTGRLAVPALRTELWLHRRDSRVGLNGSGLLVLNPPWQLATRLREVLPALHASLVTAPSAGGWSVA